MIDDRTCIINNSVNKNEIDMVLKNFNNTYTEYDKQKTVNMLFEEQVEKSEDKIAIQYHNRSITYKELNKKSNQLARKLREVGVRPNTIVALMVRRSIDMFIGILGILKAGGCYLPIDPEYPEARINYMLEDSCTRIMITQKDIHVNVKFENIIINLDDKNNYIGDESNLENVSTSNDLIYILYTSGSTGKPKGVLIEHFAVHNFITGVTNKINFNENKVIVCLTTISFDIFVLESLLPLSQGMKIIIADPMQFSKDIMNHNFDMIQTTPSTISLILSEEANLPYIEKVSDIMLGGEVFPKRLLEKLKKITNAKIYNMYGPTETTVWSSIKELTNSDEITIGNPIANTQIYILNDENIPQVVNSIGELCIAGDGVARGYLNREELTAERFSDNIFTGKGKIYKTGDLAKWLPNGEIEFLGRKDSQVKIRGFRIEIGEIEECINRYSKIKEYIVATKINEFGEKFLVVYYVSEEEINVTDIILFLSKSLPDYMIPGFYIKIDKIPLTPNGKRDILSLPDLDRRRPKLETDYVEPMNKIENIIANIWRKILNCSNVGVNDNFFELGGNSILLSHMYAQLDKNFPGQINIVDIFAYPTILKLSEFIKRNQQSSMLDNDVAVLKFPDNYYLLNCTGVERYIYKFHIEESVTIKLQEYSSENNIEILSILISVYAYLLSKITSSKDINIVLKLSDIANYKSLSVNFGKLDNFNQLIKIISDIVQSKETSLYYFKDFNKFLGLTDRSVIPIFLYNCNNIDSRFEKQGFNLYAKYYNSKLEIGISFNSLILKSNKVREILEDYINLLTGISYKF